VTRVLAIGGANVDSTYRLDSPAVLETSNVATTTRSFGGVARNVAETLGRAGVPTAILTVVGSDASGRELVEHLASFGVDTSLVRVIDGAATSAYIAILQPDGELVIGVNDMAITTELTPERIRAAQLADADWVFAECNLTSDALAAVIDERRASDRFRLAVDAISIPKVTRLPEDLSGIDVLFANLDEARALSGRAFARDRDGMVAAARAIVARGAASAVVTCGALGCVTHSAEGTWAVGAVPAQVVDVTGAGDARIAGTLMALLRGESLAEASRLGSLFATIAAESPTTISLSLDRATLDAQQHRLDDVTIEGIPA